MIIKDSFKLVSNIPNIVKFSESIIRSFYKEENSSYHVFSMLELQKNKINHFTKDKLFSFLSNPKKRESLKVINFDYPLPVTYNSQTKDIIINLKPFDVKEISSMNPNDLYAAIVYAYSFFMLVTNKFKISESYVDIIVNYFLSLYVKAFGRKYGLVGLYTTGISKLKFLVTCYILAAFFGYSVNKDLFIEASKIAPYVYFDEIDQLMRYKFSDVDQFIKAVSDLKVMPGLTVAIFTSTLYKFYGINILVGIEDCSRFFSIILAVSVPGSRILPRYLVRVNEKEYFKLLQVTRGMF